MQLDRLMNEALRGHPLGRSLAEVMAAALAAVAPAPAVRRVLGRDGRAIVVGGDRFELRAGGRVIVVGAGKAGAPMTEAAVEILGDLVGGGCVIVKEGHAGGHAGKIGAVELAEAGHPVPDERNVAASRRLIETSNAATENDFALALISGGGSALLTLPAAGLTLSDLRLCTEALLGCGASIKEMNTLRKHLTQLGGGGLARFAAPATTLALVISDVVGSPLDVIASGPTAPDPTTFADAWRIVERRDLRERLSASVLEHLRRGLSGEVSETAKPSDALWSEVRNHVIASNRTAAEAATNAARDRGFDALLLTTFLEGEAREVGRVAAAIGRELRARAVASKTPQLVVMGGETTVTLRGRGAGGRNQELALGAVEPLAGIEGVLLITLATDGGDGPTDAAGAVVTGETLAQAAGIGLAPDDFMRRNDSYNFFEPLDALLKPGPTLTNVNDLLFIAAHA